MSNPRDMKVELIELSFEQTETGGKSKTDCTFLLKGIRISFPTLWEVGEYKGKPQTRHYLKAAIPSDQVDVIKAVKRLILRTMNNENHRIKKWEQCEDSNGHLKVKPTKEGDYVTLNTSNSTDYPALYMNSHGSHVPNPLAEGADKILRSGNYANVKIQVTATEDGNIYVNLQAIQFAGEGDAFGSAPSPDQVAEGFGTVETDFETKSTESDADEDKDFVDDESGDDLDLGDDDLDLDDE